MESRQAVTSDPTMIDLNNNNNRRKKRTTTKQQQLQSLSSSKKTQVYPKAVLRPSDNHFPSQTSMKNAYSWKKRWTKWFSSCGSERTVDVKSIPITVSTEKRPRTKSENDLSKRASHDHDEKKNLSTTHSTLAVNPTSNENQERNLAKTSFQQHRHHHQSIDRVNNSNSVVYRDAARRHSNPFLASTRHGAEGGQQPQQSIRTSIAAFPSRITAQTPQKQPLSRSADRLNSKSTRRELRYEEHNDYILPSSPPLHSIQCYPAIDHYARTLNQSSYYYSTHRRSQLEVYQSSATKNRVLLPRPYSSNIPLSTALTHIPISYSSTVDQIQTMSQTAPDSNSVYGKLSECHSPLAPVESSSIKAPRRIESNYNQFPVLATTPQEPLYANTQSLYDNILYPEASSTSRVSSRNDYEKKSCASQTQLTWTMATFSSFVDLENQSIIIQQPDPTTLYSIVRHHHTQLPPSASPATVEHMKRISPNLQNIDNTISSSHQPRSRTPSASKTLMIEKRDGSFQTLLTIAPSQDIDSNKQIFLPDSTPSPLSTGSSSTADHYHQHQHHHHHRHHRRHKSRSDTNRHNNVGTRDVGLQVNIQTVKKITFVSEKSDESSLTTSASSPPTVIPTRELKHAQTNTEPSITKYDRSTSYETSLHQATSSSQTLESPTSSTRQTRAAQTSIRALRDQSIETNHRGLFVCDLSSFLKNGVEDISSTLPTTKQKS